MKRARLRHKYEKSQWIRTVTNRYNTHLNTGRTKGSHAHLPDVLPFHSLQAQILPPAVLKTMKIKEMEQLCYCFYGQTMVHARYYHILQFLHFTDNNRNGVDRRDNRVWKIRDLFEIIRPNFSKFYNRTELLAVDEVIVKFKGRIVFQNFTTQPNIWQ